MSSGEPIDRYQEGFAAGMRASKLTDGNDLPKNSPDDPQRLSEATEASLRQQIKTEILAFKVVQVGSVPEVNAFELTKTLDRIMRLLAAQQTALLEDIRKNGTYLKKDFGFAPGLWLKVDIIDEALSKLRKEIS